MSKVTKRGWLGLLALALGFSGLSTVKAQEPVWSVKAPQSWFTSGSDVRGFTYNAATNHIIVASRTGGVVPVVLDAATGDSIGVLDATGVTGGTFPYNKIMATTDGQIFASNLVTAADADIIIYRWANESAAPEVVYTGKSLARAGDSFTALGSGNNVTLLLSGSGSDKVQVFEWDGTAASLKNSFDITTNKASGGFSGLVAENTVYITANGFAPSTFNFADGTVGSDLVVTGVSATNFNSTPNIDVFTVFGKSYMVAGPSSDGAKFYIIDLSDNSLNATFNAGTAANSTRLGDIRAFGSNFYVLNTNNELNSYNVFDFAKTAVFTDYFEYEVDSKLTDNGWISHSGAGTNSLKVNATQLTYPGYAGNFGNSVSMVATGEDVHTGFGANITTGSVFASALVNIADAKDAGEYFFHFVNSQGTGAEFRARVTVKKDANDKLAFGVSKAAAAASAGYTGFDYDLNTTYLLVLEYQRVEGDKNDIVNLYVNPVGSELPDAPTVTALDNTTATDIVELSDIAIRQGTAQQGATLLIGNLRVGIDYATVVGNPELPVSEPKEISVTFNLNMATSPDTVTANDVILVNGAVKGSRGSDTFLDGETLGFDGSATAKLTHVNGDYWTGTFKLLEGDTLQYKYRFQNAAGTKDQDEQGKLVLEADNPSGWDTRFFIAGDEDAVLDMDYWEVQETATGITSGIPFFTNKEDTVAFYFRVNVGAAIQAGEFDVDTDSVGVRGTPAFFGNPDDWGSTAFYLTKEEKVSGENQMYSGALYLPKSAVTVGDTYIYKFVTETGADNTTNWDLDPNHELIGTHENTTIQYQYFQNRKPSAAPLVDALLEFKVDVGILEGLGYFDAGVGDKVQIRGDFNGWGGSNPLTFNPVTFNWELSGYSIKRAVGDQINYKYYIAYDQTRFDETSPNYLQGINDDFGYEEPGLTGGGNRVYTFTNVGAPETQGPPPTFYNGIDPRGLIDSPIDVTFSIDMNPALSYSDPFSPAVDTVYIQFETKYFALVNGFSGDLNKLPEEDLSRLRLTDDDGDGIYTVTISLATPSPNHIGFKIIYGQIFAENGRTIETGEGYDAGRRYYQYIHPTVDANKNIIWPATYELPTLTWKEKDLPWEPALDYDQLQGVAIEKTDGLANAFALNQNYPNPFNPSTVISFQLAQTSNVTLSVYNLLGQKVATLINNNTMNSGLHAVSFDASRLSSGTYFYRIEAGNFVSTKKMLLIK